MEHKLSKYTNLESNVAAALAYIITPFSGIFLLLVEKEDKFVRFHAMQSVLFGFFAYGAWILANISVLIIIGLILMPVLAITIFFTYAILMWKAYSGEEYLLPIIGKMAKDKINKE